MGNYCKCDIFLNDKKNDETNMDELKNNNGINSNRPIEVVSQFSQLSPKDKGNKLNKTNLIKNNLEKKLPEMGTFILLNEYKKSINDDIHNYIKEKKLNFQSYLSPNISTFASDPIKFKNNNIYCGNWNENIEMEGYGIYYISDRNVVTEGVWNKGNIVFGRTFFPNGDIYEGEMKDSVPNGKGKLIFKNGESYEGDFKMGEMSGKGTFIFEDKTEYSGGIENGIFNGKGKMKWENGTEYIGNFVDSSLCGIGTITNIQKEKYEGTFDKNEFNGQGIYYFSNGDEYEGKFEYGIKRGKGIYRRNDKVNFEGVWNDDLPNGNGVITYSGNELRGFWRNGAFVGNAEIEKGNIESFNNIDKDIKPYKISIYPSSLSHLAITDSNASQFIPGKDFNFV